MKQIVRLFLIAGAVLFTLQCQDQNAPLSIDGGEIETAGTDPIVSLMEQLLQTGHEQRARDFFKSLSLRRSAGDLPGARKQVLQLIDYLLLRFEREELEDPNGGDPPTTEEALALLIQRLLEFVGLFGGDPIPAGAFTEDGAFERCGPAGCTIVTGTEFAGVVIPPGALDHAVFIAIARLPNTPSPLPTDMDWYPLFYDFSIHPNEDLSPSLAVVGPQEAFASEVDVALCALDNPPHPLGAPPSVVPNLALAHPDSTGNDLEILPPGPTGFIDCTDANTTALRTGRFEEFLAGLFRPFGPDLLLAMPGGVGGKASSFSPFGAVDTTSGSSEISTTTALDAEPDTVLAGETVTLTATVSPAPFLAESPTVEFFDGANSLGTAPADSFGVATLVVGTGACEAGPCLGTGGHSLTAEFLGTTSHAPSTSDPVPVLVLFPSD